MAFWIGLVIGFIAGGFLGLLIMAILVMASRSNRQGVATANPRAGYHPGSIADPRD